MFLIFDTETTGLPIRYDAPLTDFDNWPRAVQISWQLHDNKGHLIHAKNYIIKPEGFNIPFIAAQVHHITTERAINEGIPLEAALNFFNADLSRCQFIVGHNVSFDVNILGAEFLRKNIHSDLVNKNSIDTQKLSTEYCALPGGRGGKFKWPKLEELHQKLFGTTIISAHNAIADVEATARCFFQLILLKVITVKQAEIQNEIITYLNSIAPQILTAITPQNQTVTSITTSPSSQNKEAPFDKKNKLPFVHLHCHSQYSLEPSTSDIDSIIQMAIQAEMSAVALTDHGNLYGAFLFVQKSLQKGIKPILGCEFYLALNALDKKNKDNGFTQVLIAKNKKGYHNLIQLSTYSFVEGFYYVPRIDKNILVQHNENLIATTGSLRSEIPHLLLHVGEAQAEQAFVWWHENFGENFYVELQRHDLEEENYVNKILIEWAEKYNVKYFASNNTYYNEKGQFETHQILQCIIDGNTMDMPVGKGRGYRYSLPNDQFYFKNSEEMRTLFYDLPQAIENANFIADQIELYDLKHEILLPKFSIPQGFKNENDYLKHLTFQGAKRRYANLTDEIINRLDFELSIIEKTGYPGYFLIVQDICAEARKRNVLVGPGRGSAAGSAVAYCLEITNVDPIVYKLLFERFLNPDRVSMPDIDIDFDDKGRGKVMQYVLEKYGENQVAQIITYGTMAAKSALRNVARVLNFSVQETNTIAKMLPDFIFKIEEFSKRPLKKLIFNPNAYKTIEDFYKENKSQIKPDDLQSAHRFIELSKSNTREAKVLQQAAWLEGTIRNTGVHACGVIVAPDNLRNYVPLKMMDEGDIKLLIQYDNSVAESAGLLKIDFLGLSTLTIIEDAIRLVHKTRKIKIERDEIPLTDAHTYQLFQQGKTIGVFQYESVGMQKYLKELKPDKFEDLIAMNALYRPGPMQYLSEYINRKHGISPIEYDLPEMEDLLSETYGITVYQEQVMLLSQHLAGFTKGQADELRKAMGKKLKDKIDKLQPLFIEGCVKNNHSKEIAEKIWRDWEAFAQYAFNKSHATCYAILGFQTAFLKANFTAEFMAAVLSNKMNDIKQITFFMEECKNLGLKVLGPSVNESEYRFTVNSKGEIRFGLGAIKGVGEGAVESIVLARQAAGDFQHVFDFTSRIDLRQANKRTLESLILAGAFDEFIDIHRAQYFYEDNGASLIEKAIKYGNNFQAEKYSAQNSLFGELTPAKMIMPEIPKTETWNIMEKLNKEKEVLGIYLSEHPLDTFKLHINYCCNTKISDLENIEYLRKLNEIVFAGMVTDSSHNTGKTGKKYGSITIEDYDSSKKLMLFGDTYMQYRNFLNQGDFLLIKGSIQKKYYGNNNAENNLSDKDQFEFKITHIETLAEALERYKKQVEISLNMYVLTPEVITEILKIIAEHQGNFTLKIQLFNPKNQETVQMVSGKYKVDFNEGFIQKIKPFLLSDPRLN